MTDGIHFYHADNIEQILEHFKKGRLLTRSDLISSSSEKTNFYSDNLDKILGFQDRIFGNIYDLGEIFVRGTHDCAPYIYGPIVLVFRPDTYSLMTDIIITPNSIASHKDRWRDYYVQAEQTVEKILAGTSFPEDKISRPWQGCELSCDKITLPLSYLDSIIVEPIKVKGWQLSELVSIALEEYKISVPIYERRYRDKNPKARETIISLCNFCHELPADIKQSQWDKSVTQLPETLGDLTDSQKTRFLLWCRYFYYGTLRKIIRSKSID